MPCAALRSPAVPAAAIASPHGAPDDAALDDLARLAAAGDPTAAGGLVRNLAQPVQRLAAALVDSASAEDLAQETFLRALGALPTWRGDAPVRLWLLSVCRRVCADEIRRRRRRRVWALDPASVTETTVVDPTQALASYDLLNHLDPDRRAAFAATQLLGLSYAEAATLCGCPVGTIRSRVARAREQLVADVRAAEAG
jgi:RNA polymerase sigma-70 factor (ECF subfamily)